ncbi:hypothetical protein G6K96_21500 [Agrobacterium vitis]|uniref:hypothetical protein n=1 Tax=Agrobacterium vitis TaxID=373 RepID=UPI00157426CF|nr:hypothetical protein [Agrobacterium vitis]NTA34310.1 hypothetical protein [Agrobacterium vitis]
MFASLSDIVKIPAAIAIGAVVVFLLMFFHYEGLRVFGWQVVDGRVSSAVAVATSELVNKAEVTALQAQLDRERELRAAAEQSATEANKRAEAARAAKDKAMADYAAMVAADPDGGESRVTKEDREWIAKHSR